MTGKWRARCGAASGAGRAHGLPRIAALGLALVAMASQANGPGLPAPLAPYEAEYRVSRGPVTLGRSTTRLAAVAEGWEYRTVVEATGVASLLVSGDATERTLLEVHDGGLRTLAYHQRLPDDGGEIRIRFDWPFAQALVDHHEDGSTMLPLAAGTKDPHAAILAVVQALANGGDLPSFEIIDDDGELVRLDFQHRGRKRIRVPLGEFDTIEVRRVEAERDRQLIAWFAPELDWLPVRIEQVDKGSTVARMDLRRLNDREAQSRVRGPAQRR